LKILGIATSSTKSALSQHDAASFAVKSLGSDASAERGLRNLYRLSSVENRHTFLSAEGGQKSAFQSFYPPRNQPEELGPTTAERLALFTRGATQLAIPVARNALKNSKIEASEVTHIVTVSCTGFEAPGFDFQLIWELNLPSSVQRTHIGFMGCHAAVNALRVAQAFAAQGGVVLVVCVELCSLHFSYAEGADQTVANSLFSDGAAAVVVANRQGDLSRTDLIKLSDFGSDIIPNSNDAMAWRVTDNGFQMSLSPKVPALIAGSIEATLAGWLAKRSLSVGKIGGWAIHPGGPRVLDAAQRALALTDQLMSPSRDVLAKHGNMSSPTVLFIIEKLIELRAPLPWMVLGFGPGLVAEFGLIDSQ